MFPIECLALPSDGEIGEAKRTVSGEERLLIAEGHPTFVKHVRDDHLRLRQKHIATQRFVDLPGLIPAATVPEGILGDMKREQIGIDLRRLRILPTPSIEKAGDVALDQQRAMAACTCQGRVNKLRRNWTC